MPAAPTADALWPNRFAGRRGTEAIIIQAACAVGDLIRRGGLPQKSEVRLDPITELLRDDPRVTRLIGQVEPAGDNAWLPNPVRLNGPRGKKPIPVDSDDEPNEPVWPNKETPSWVAVERGGVFAAVVRLGFRGARVVGKGAPDKGPSMVRHVERGKDALYTLGVAEKKGWKKGHWRAQSGVESERLYSYDAFVEAVAQVEVALRRAGCVLAARTEVAQAHGAQSATAAIWIRTLAPALSSAAALGSTMAR